MPRLVVIRSIGSAFKIGSFRVVILKPFWVIELPASAVDGYRAFGSIRPLTGMMGADFNSASGSAITVLPTCRIRDRSLPHRAWHRCPANRPDIDPPYSLDYNMRARSGSVN